MSQPGFLYRRLSNFLLPAPFPVPQRTFSNSGSRPASPAATYSFKLRLPPVPGLNPARPLLQRHQPGARHLQD